MNYRLLLCLLSFLCYVCIDESESIKILALPIAIQNHVTEMDALGRELVKRGHEIVFLLPWGFDTSQLGDTSRVIGYGHKMVDKMNTFFNMVNKQDTPLEKMSELRQIICSHIEKDVGSLKKLQEERFDLAIVEFVFFIKCLYLVPYNLSIPFVSLGSEISRLEIGHPITNSFLPHILSPFHLKIPFHERLGNFLYHFFSRLLINWSISQSNGFNIAPKLSWNDQEDLPKMSDLFIESSDTVLDFPEPVMPNFIRVGCLRLKRADPISFPISEFFDSANNGIIIISFGSKFKTGSLIHSLFLSVFRNIKWRVFWKCDSEEQHENILMYSGLSENDALAHPSSKLFIYHCGRQGLFESVYNGVPILCIPNSAEQFDNARKITHFQIGRFLQISQLNEHEIQHAITDILEETKYSANIKKLSKIFRGRPETPAEQAATAVEYVMNFGANHLRSHHSEQSPFQILHGDIWLAVFLIFTFTCLFLLLIVWKCCFLAFSIKNKLKIH